MLEFGGVGSSDAVVCRSELSMWSWLGALLVDLLRTRMEPALPSMLSEFDAVSSACDTEGEWTALCALCALRGCERL